MIVRVMGDSMTPTLADHGLMFCERVSPFMLKRGDIVVVRALASVEHFVVKRLVGLPGDDLAQFECGFGVVPEGQGVILSDNRLRRGDSRDIGPIPLSRVVARKL